MTQTKVVDGFVWLVVTQKAKEIFSSGTFELYKLYDDGSEALINDQYELSECLEYGYDIGIEVGYLVDIIKL